MISQRVASPDHNIVAGISASCLTADSPEVGLDTLVGILEVAGLGATFDESASLPSGVTSAVFVLGGGLRTGDESLPSFSGVDVALLGAVCEGDGVKDGVEDDAFRLAKGGLDDDANGPI